MGTLPASIGLANTAIDWDGHKWTIILWPLPSDRNQRLALMLHESFHRIQDAIHGQSREPSSRRLDGRYYLQLEWRALTAALKSGMTGQRRAVEMNEGLAEIYGRSSKRRASVS